MGMQRWTALAGVAFVVLWISAFTLGIEVGHTDREILDHYADSGSRTKEGAAFFLIAAAALAFLLFAAGLRSLVARVEEQPQTLAALAWAGAIGCSVLLLAGNAVSRATAFAAMDDEFLLAPNTHRLFEDAGLLLLASGALAAMVLVVAVSLAAPALRRPAALARLGGLSRRPAAARDRVRRLPRADGVGARGQRDARPAALGPRDGLAAE